MGLDFPTALHKSYATINGCKSFLFMIAEAAAISFDFMVAFPVHLTLDSLPNKLQFSATCVPAIPLTINEGEDCNGICLSSAFSFIATTRK